MPLRQQRQNLLRRHYHQRPRVQMYDHHYVQVLYQPLLLLQRRVRLLLNPLRILQISLYRPLDHHQLPQEFPHVVLQADRTTSSRDPVDWRFQPLPRFLLARDPRLALLISLRFPRRATRGASPRPAPHPARHEDRPSSRPTPQRGLLPCPLIPPKGPLRSPHITPPKSLQL